MTRKRSHRLDGATQSAQDLVAVYGVSAQGNVTSESYYGGDAAGGHRDRRRAISARWGCRPRPRYQINHTYSSGVRATSQYAGTSFYALDQTIDAGTGLVSVEPGQRRGSRPPSSTTRWAG